MSSTEKSHFTVGELAKLLDEPEWRVRRIVDQIDADIPRAGQYRLVPGEFVGRIQAALQHLPRRNTQSSKIANQEV